MNDDYLDDVDWDSLDGPYGPASDVPNLLRALQSQDPAARFEAEEQLGDNHLQHQGLVCEPSAAVAPYLIGLLADSSAPDRLAVYRLLRMILHSVELYESPWQAEAPTLDDLAWQRSDWWLARSPEWRRHGGYQRPVTSACAAGAYEAVRAGVPTYLQVLRDQDRDLRLGMADLLAHFPQERATISPVLAEQLSVEVEPTVAAAMCIAAGLAGRPSDGVLVEAVNRWRGSHDQFVHRASLMGLVRLLAAPDTALLAELSDCLFEPPAPDWPFYGGTMANTTASALGGVTGNSVPQLAGLLLERLRVPGPDRIDFFALLLLLGLTFPGGPLPDGTAFVDLSASQQEVVRVVLQAGLLTQGPMMPRAVGECNLPYTEEGLAAWCAGRTAV